MQGVHGHDPTRYHPSHGDSTMSVRIGVVGGAWRAQFFGRLARDLPEDFELVGMTARTTETREAWRQTFRSPTYDTVGELVAGSRPDLVVVAVSHSSNEGVIREVVSTGAHVLAETPPATDVAGLRRLWQDVGTSSRVQVAEQYPLLPGHAARRAVVERGTIGEVTQVQVSSTHGYHAVALIRSFLGAGFGPATVTAHRHVAPLLDPEDRSGWHADPQVCDARTTLAVLDLPEGTGLYDFTDNQWHNRLLHRRILIRGTRGEIQDDSVLHLPEPRTIVRSSIERHQLGYDLDLDGFDTSHLTFEGSVVHRNPFLGARLADEEIAIATLMRAAGAWARDEGEAPCPLAQGLQDQLLALAIEESARTATAVRTAVEPWGRTVS